MTTCHDCLSDTHIVEKCVANPAPAHLGTDSVTPQGAKQHSLRQSCQVQVCGL
jgi:hypothetical protein